MGVFRPGVMNFIGNGVVLDPAVLFAEIDEFLARGVAISPQNLRVSYKTHLVMPYHKQEDAARESSRCRRQPLHRHHPPRHRAGLRGKDASQLRAFAWPI